MNKLVVAGLKSIVVPGIAALLGRNNDAKDRKKEKMDATELLHTQHQKVKGIFAKLENGKGDPIANVLELINNLAAHMAIEQDIFYPEVIAADPDLVSEAFEEHSIAEFALKRLLATDPADDAFKARVVAAKELIEHHVKEEEEELFKKVKKMLDKDRLEELGAQMKTRFDEIYAAGYQSAVPSRLDKTSADAARADLHVTDGSHEAPARRPSRGRKAAPSSRKRASAAKPRRAASGARARTSSSSKSASPARSLPRIGKAKAKKTSRASR
jgi:hypothetical protein